MNYKASFAFVILTTAVSTAFAQLDNFLVVNSAGVLYEVNGNTLQATEIQELELGSFISEIAYIGNDEILTSTVGAFTRYNLRTGVETTEFIISDILPNPSLLDLSMTGALTAQRNIYIGIKSYPAPGDQAVDYGILYNPLTKTVTEMAQYADSPLGYYFDFLELGNHIFLGSDFEAQIARTFDSETGETISEFSTPVGAVSFLTLDGSVYALTKNRKLYSFDTSNGMMEFYGNIFGMYGAAIGATSMTVRQTSDINYDGSRDFFDVLYFLENFEAQNPVADWTDDGVFDFYDVSAFVTIFVGE